VNGVHLLEKPQGSTSWRPSRFTSSPS
jgi:hypothetical protein